MCLAHWLHIWLRSQQLGFESRQLAKYGIVQKSKNPRNGIRDPGNKKSLKKKYTFLFSLFLIKNQLIYLYTANILN